MKSKEQKRKDAFLRIRERFLGFYFRNQLDFAYREVTFMENLLRFQEIKTWHYYDDELQKKIEEIKKEYHKRKTKFR